MNGGGREGGVTFSCQDCVCVTSAAAEMMTVQNLESQ